jgi:hypothetical protein
MPIQPDKEQRIALLQAGLLELDLEWNQHYRLVHEGPRRALEFLKPVRAAAQHERAHDLLERIMNKYQPY